MEYNEEAQRWEFFYDGIEGFVFEPGYIYTLEVRLEEREHGDTGCRTLFISPYQDSG